LAGRDITEGRGDSSGYGKAIAVDIGIVSTSSVWQNTDVAYDVAIGGIPFIYAINDTRPYVRQTAPFKKDQFDNGQEPGEQSLTGWWIRSQASFHSGQGIKFYDTTGGETTANRFADSKGVNVWTRGQVTLLPSCDAVDHYTTSAIATNGRVQQRLRSIQWGTTSGVLLHDGYDVDKIATNGVVTHFQEYNAGADYPVYSICDDGTYAYFVTNKTGSPNKMFFYKKLLTGSYLDTETTMFSDTTLAVTATMEYVKERIILCLNNKIYEVPTSSAALPAPIYTHPLTDYVYTSVTASGPAIYVSGYSGLQSTIHKFTLTSTGTLPTLTSAVTAAELPVGEIVHKIFYYLGYMMIGTSKGIRAANVSDQDGSISYGPLIVNTTQPCYDFAARDKFVWCATGVDGYAGTIRVDLGNEIESLRFAYANDVYSDASTGYSTTACAFAKGTDRLAFVTTALSVGSVNNKALTSNVATLTTSAAHGLVVGDSVWIENVDSVFNGKFTVVAVPTTTTFTYAKTNANVTSVAVSPVGTVNKIGSINIESDSTLMTSGYLTTGNIRYGTLEPKNFKRLVGRGDFSYGSMTLSSVKSDAAVYDHISYDSSIGAPEVTTSQPETAQEYLAYKFQMYRDSTDSTKGPTFKGYQAKATIATPRQRVVQFPVYCFDVETDRYNTVIGYEGRAFDRIKALEHVEENGDVLTWQDLSTGESRQAVIEQVTFTRMTPPDKRFDGFGGVLEVRIRTV